jgi:hypothetical protein
MKHAREVLNVSFVNKNPKANRPLSVKTLRLRALHDRRGELIREGVSYRAGRVHDWRIIRSVRGRINQVDLIIDGQRWRTGSLERAEIAVASGVWRVN